MKEKITRWFVCYLTGKQKIENSIIDLDKHTASAETYSILISIIADQTHDEEVRLINVSKLDTYGREVDGDEINRWCH